MGTGGGGRKKSERRVGESCNYGDIEIVRSRREFGSVWVGGMKGGG